MGVRDLIAAGRAKTERAFPPEVLADLKEVLKANDRETNRLARVSLAAFIDHCAKVHKYRIGRSTFNTRLLSQLKRGWDK